MDNFISDEARDFLKLNKHIIESSISCETLGIYIRYSKLPKNIDIKVAHKYCYATKKKFTKAINELVEKNFIKDPFISEVI